MSTGQALAILGAGLAAGAINAVVGSGTLITFPVLLAFGYPAVTANVTNTIGLVPGAAGGAAGYRHELAGQGARARRLGAFSAAGGLVGATLLLALPASVFRAVIPFLIAVAVALVLIQPWLSARLRSREGTHARHQSSVAPAGVFLTGVYGGYFGGAQSIILIAVLALAYDEHLQRLNALKNVLTGLVNLVASVVFVLAAHVAWDAAALIAAGSIVGGYAGAHAGRRLPAGALRALILLVGLVAVVRLAA